MTVTLERPAPPAPPAPPEPGSGGPRRGPHPRALQVFVGLVVAAVAMFFVGLSAALLARMGAGGWGRFPPPAALWVSGTAIVLSSGALELARRSLRRGDGAGFRRNLAASGALGLSFLAGQLAAWQSLASSGVALATSPAGSYFYLLSGAHLAHVLGGLGWWLALWARTGGRDPQPVAVDGYAVYWHFLAGLWIYLFAVLFAL
jgi:cytochrome c oxidase subunit 3